MSMRLQSSSLLPGELSADILGRPGGELVTHQGHPEDGGLGDEQEAGHQLGGGHQPQALGAAVLEAEQGGGGLGRSAHQESGAGDGGSGVASRSRQTVRFCQNPGLNTFRGGESHTGASH